MEQQEQQQQQEQVVNNHESFKLSEASALLNEKTMRTRLNIEFIRFYRERSPLVDLLAIFFGIGAWIGINGTYIQLPLLVEAAPEGWSLPSYISVVVQMGNLGAILYTVMQTFWKKNDAYLIYALLSLSTISTLLTSFFYDRTAVVFGAQHSIGLIILVFFNAINACTSSVLFMPYMGRFKEIYLVSYFIGEGLSGLLPSLLALIQGVGSTNTCDNTKDLESRDNANTLPLFSSELFFILMFVMMLFSLVSFLLLDRLKLAKKEYAACQVKHGNDYIYEREIDSGGIASRSADNTNDTAINTTNRAREISTRHYIFLLVLIGIINFFANGIFNSIQSYSCLPYGNRAYHLAIILSVTANPLACFLALFLPNTSLYRIFIMSSLCGLITIYVFITATMSPQPPLHGTTIGAVLVIASWTLLVGMISYLKLSIATVMRFQGGKSLVWTGAFTQIGSLIGSLLIFGVINYTNIFTAAQQDDC